MTINVIVAKQAINNKPIWIFVDQIVAMTMNDQGKAVFRTTDGMQTAITDTPEEVIKTIKRMVGDSTPPIDRTKVV